MSNVNDILAVPLDLPRFEPDSWETFWKIWEEDAMQFLRLKPDAQGNNAKEPGWNGLVWDFFRPDLKDSFTMFKTTVKDYSDVFPRWRESMERNFPFRIRRISFLNNYREIGPHKDGLILTDHLPYAAAVRILLVDDNKVPTFWFSKEQSVKSDRFYMDLPPETNTFVYNNPKIYHAADHHGKRKILMMLIFDQIDEKKWVDLLSRSRDRWPERTWVDQRPVGDIT